MKSSLAIKVSLFVATASCSAYRITRFEQSRGSPSFRECTVKTGLDHQELQTSCGEPLQRYESASQRGQVCLLYDNYLAEAMTQNSAPYTLVCLSEGKVVSTRSLVSVPVERTEELKTVHCWSAGLKIFPPPEDDSERKDIATVLVYDPVRSFVRLKDSTGRIIDIWGYCRLMPVRES